MKKNIFALILSLSIIFGQLTCFAEVIHQNSVLTPLQDRMRQSAEKEDAVDEELPLPENINQALQG